MTIASPVARVSYAGSGTTGPFAVPFRFFSLNDLEVIVTTASGLDVPLVNGPDFTGTGERNASGTITLTVPLATGERLTILRDPSIVQKTSFRNQGSYFGSAHEDALDQIVMQVQALKDQLDRAVGLPASLDPAAHSLELTPETGKALVWQSASQLGNATLDAGAIAIPGGGRTVPTLSAYLANNTVVNVKDFLAAGNGIADDTTAIQAAMNAAVGKTLRFPAGTYRITAEIVGVSNVDIRGEVGSTIKSTAKIRSYFYFGAQSGIDIRGLTFDLAQDVLPTYTEAEISNWYNVAVYAFQSANIVVADCTFTKLYTEGMLFYQCTGTIQCLRNTHTSPAQLQGSRGDHLLFQSCTSDIVVDHCLFDNARPSGPGYGVISCFASSTTGKLTFSENVTHYGGRNGAVTTHVLGAFSCYGDDQFVRVLENQFFNTLERTIRLTACHHVQVRGNHCEMSDIASASDPMISLEGTVSFAATKGIVDAKVWGNTLIDDYSTTRVGIFVGAYDYGAPSTDVVIRDNELVNIKQAVSIAGPYNAVKVMDNKIRGANGGIIQVLQQVPGAGITALEGVTEAQSVYHDLMIRGNSQDLASNTATPITLDYRKTPAYTGTITDVDVSDNIIRIASASVAVAIVLRGTTASSTGRFTFRRNKVDGYTYFIDGSDAEAVIIEGNLGRNLSTGVAFGMTGIGTLERSGNRWNTGPLSGRSVLTAGGALVVTAEILTGDTVQLQRVVSGGTAGDLIYNTIINKTSFEIHSSSGTDTSTVFWKIVH
jgi:hypothetical protein